jgi:Cd(II)/Pb(II)-responsive transcriptional regulator
MKIGELAQAAKCTVETIRYYEKEGLLPEPGRTASKYRCYGEEHVERLRFIRNCRALDMTHQEIRTLLGAMDRPSSDCTPVNELLDEHIAHVDVRIEELERLKRQLAGLRNRCRSESSVESCGILQGLADMEPEAKPHRDTHLG